MFVLSFWYVLSLHEPILLLLILNTRIIISSLYFLFIPQVRKYLWCAQQHMLPLNFFSEICFQKIEWQYEAIQIYQNLHGLTYKELEIV